MRHKKLGTIILAGLLLVACGDDEDNTTPDSQNNQTPESNSEFMNNNLAITYQNATDTAKAVLGTQETLRDKSGDWKLPKGVLALDLGYHKSVKDGITRHTYSTTAYSHKHQVTGITETFRDFTLTVIDNPNDASETWEINGTYGNSKLNGAVVIKTLHPFVKTGKYPYEGTLNITGLNNSSVKVMAVDEVTVRLEVDEDGDGAKDKIIDVVWGSLVDAPDNADIP